MRIFNQSDFSGISNYLLSVFMRGIDKDKDKDDDDEIKKLEMIMNSPNTTITSSKMSYREEIERLASVLTFLTHTHVPIGAISLDPKKNDEVVLFFEDLVSNK